MQSLPSPLWCSAQRLLAGRSPQRAGTLRLWLQPMAHPLKTDLEVLESLSLRRMGDGAQPEAISQVPSWAPGGTWFLWAWLQGGQPQSDGDSWRSPGRLHVSWAQGLVRWAEPGWEDRSLSIGCITLWPFCHGFPSAKIVQIKLVENKVSDDSLTSLPSVALPPPSPSPMRSSLGRPS